MRQFDFATFDVFTSERFAGNQLAVIFGADSLSTEEMLQVTREFNYAESTFVLAPADAENTARVRIFTPGYEMPFAGHPTVGTAVAIAERRGLDGELRLELKAGLFPVQVDVSGDAAFAEFENPNLPAETGSAPDAALIEKALCLTAGSVDRAAHRPRIVGAGISFLYAKAPIEAVRSARLAHAHFDELALGETVGVLVYAEGGDAEDAAYHVRMFAPGAGVLEDAATGSAAAALPGQIALSERLADGDHRWVIEQGAEMGRPSRIGVSLEIDDGRVRRVRVGGSARRMTRGVIEL